MKEAWWLAKKEIRFNWLTFVATLIASMFLGLLTYLVMEQLASWLINQPYTRNARLPLDIIFLGITPSLAVLFVSTPYTSFKAIKQDPFSKRMAIYRALPIRVETLALSRTLYMLVVFIVMTIAFYSILLLFLYQIAPFDFRQLFTMEQFLMFIGLWFGYALTFSGLLMYVESGVSTRMIWVLSFVFLIVYIVGLLWFHHYFGYGVVEWTLNLVKKHGWLPAILLIGVGVASCFAWNTVLTKRLLRRDYV